MVLSTFEDRFGHCGSVNEANDTTFFGCPLVQNTRSDHKRWVRSPPIVVLMPIIRHGRRISNEGVLHITFG